MDDCVGHTSCTIHIYFEQKNDFKSKFAAFDCGQYSDRAAFLYIEMGTQLSHGLLASESLPNRLIDDKTL